MKRILIAITLLLLITGLTADAQWRSETHDEYHALQRPADITIDGELDDAEGWEGVFESVTGTDGEPYCGVEFEGRNGEVKVWEDLGGTWKNASDHETCFAIVWDEDAIYIALSVTDDEHEHADGSAWKGDGAQILIVPSGMREAGEVHFRYNIALRDNGDIILNNEHLNNRPGLTNDDIAIVRNEDEKETYYEIKITPENLGLKDPFNEDYEFALGICVNDGDKNAPGQTGWSGWYPHAIVHNKNTEKTGLVVLTDEQLAVEAKNKLTTTWGRLKSTH